MEILSIRSGVLIIGQLLPLFHTAVRLSVPCPAIAIRWMPNRKQDLPPRTVEEAGKVLLSTLVVWIDEGTLLVLGELAIIGCRYELLR